MNYNLEALQNDARLLDARIVLADTMLNRVSAFDGDVFEWKKDEETGELLVDKDGNYNYDYRKLDIWYMNRLPAGFSDELASDMARELKCAVEDAILAWARGKKTASK